MDRRSFLLGSTAGAIGLSLPMSTNKMSIATDEKVKPVDELVTPKAVNAIQTGLGYIARHQVRGGAFDGAFGRQGYAAGVAVTSLCGMAFLCSGSTPCSLVRIR